MKESAGTLLYRMDEGQLEVLIVHPSGNYNRHKPWSIPKGLPDAGETLEAAARRETLEETGVSVGEIVSLGFVTYAKSGKRIHAFAGPWAGGAPHCACWEVDAALFVPIAKARELLHPDQRPLLDRLEERLKANAAE
jgi:predicted NUDIX family NTP pyrophosphohydrolase